MGPVAGRQGGIWILLHCSVLFLIYPSSESLNNKGRGFTVLDLLPFEIALDRGWVSLGKKEDPPGCYSLSCLLTSSSSSLHRDLRERRSLPPKTCHFLLPTCFLSCMMLPLAVCIYVYA